MEYNSVLIENFVGIFFGALLIFGRLKIEKIFMKNPLYHKGKLKVFNHKTLMVIIWIVGLVFILGGIFGLIKIFTIK
jgi:hypothetical protein